MIISCEQCNKKFEIDSNLIPKDGRLLECGSCNHKWFYKQNIENKTEEILIEPQLKDIVEKAEAPKEVARKETDYERLPPDDEEVLKKGIVENKKISILNIIIVFIISFVALIILIETFKDPISIFIPNIKFILNSLYEVIRDIILFIKDLIK